MGKSLPASSKKDNWRRESVKLPAPRCGRDIASKCKLLLSLWLLVFAKESPIAMVMLSMWSTPGGLATA